MKNALPPGRALGLYSHTAEAYYNTDSVVYYDSIFNQVKQENDKSARFLVFGEVGVSIVIAEGRKSPISLFIAPQTLSCAPRRKNLHNPVLRVTMRQTETQNASRPEPVKHHRFRAGSVFDHINDHRQLRTTCETQF